MYTFKEYNESADYIGSRLGGFMPEVLLILGSGLGFMGDSVENPVCVDYAGIPGFRVSTAPGHAGRFVFGTLGGKRVAVMQGRLHCYEGYTMEEVAFPVRVLKLLGADKLIVTNAAGAVNESFRIGDLMIISDHIRLFGFGPLLGPNIPEFGPRFNDMTDAYDREYIAIAGDAASEMGLAVRRGVYMYFPGPSFETPSEVKAARVLGADAVGMSTVPEVTVAKHSGMRVLGISLLSNMAAGITGEKLSSEEVNATAEKASGQFGRLVRKCLERM